MSTCLYTCPYLCTYLFACISIYTYTYVSLEIYGHVQGDVRTYSVHVASELVGTLSVLAALAGVYIQFVVGPSVMYRVMLTPCVFFAALSSRSPRGPRCHSETPWAVT